MTIPEAALRALAEHGLRCDMNPTHDMSSLDASETFWHRYLRMLDTNIRQLATNALEAAPSPPDSSQGEPFGWMVGTNFYTAAELGVSGKAVVAHPDAIPLYRYPMADGKPLAFRVTGPKGESGWRDANLGDESGTLLEATIAAATRPENAGKFHIEIAYAAPQSAPKAAAVGDFNLFTSPMEPQARHWLAALNEAREKWFTGITIETLPDWIEQRARSLAQAEPAK